MGLERPSASQRLLRNAAANWGGFTVQMAVAFVMAPLLVHGLGDRRYGIWALIESILAYLTLFDLGVAAAVVRYVARFQAVRDQDSLNRVFSTAVCFFAAAGVVVLLIVVVLACLGTHVLPLPEDLSGEAQLLLLLLGFNLAVGLPLGTLPAILDGLGQYPVKTAVRTGLLLVRLPVVLLVLRHGGGLAALGWAITGCNLIEHVALAGAVCWCLPELRFSVKLVNRNTLRLIRGYSVDAFLAMLAGRISYQTDALVIGAFLAPQHITLFAVAARLVECAKNALRACTTVLTPAVSSLEAQGDLAAIRRLLLVGMRYVLWAILPWQVGLLILGKPFLQLWIGPRLAEGSYPVLIVLTLPLGLALAQSVAARILYGMGRLRWLARMVLIEAAINLTLSLALVRPFGIVGVAWGTALPSIIVNSFLVAYTVRLLEIPWADFCRTTIIKPVLASALLVLFWLGISSRFEPDRWLSLLGLVTMGLAGYAMLVVLSEPATRQALTPFFRKLTPHWETRLDCRRSGTV